MSDLPGSADIAEFGMLLAALIGLQFAEAKYDDLGHVLHNRMQSHNLGCAAYLEYLRHAPNRDELARLARDLTIGETYFLRHAEQFQALTELVLPEYAARAVALPVGILSAGCSSGEEAYSIAMMLRERFPQLASDITAFDLNPAVLEKAGRGIYGKWALRACSDATRAHWFKKSGDNVELDPEIRAMVRFEERNLAESAPGFWLEARFDVIFCRNVLMYFSPAQAQAAVARMAYALAPGGYLFLGHAETLRGLSNDFHLCHTHETFYYQRKDVLARHEEPGGEPASRAPQAQRPLHPLHLPHLGQDSGWFDAIARASERVRVLIPAEAGRDAAPRTEPDDGDTLLLKAINASHGGELDEAEALCRRLLADDEMSAGAHYVLALCREGRGAADDAFEHDRIAAYLDPGFAMPRLHMGLSLRRAGQRLAARHELETAATLLQLEDPARVLLFGGGFQRDALIALCRAELDALETQA